VAGLDVAGLVRVAHDHDCLIELLPHIGDFVALAQERDDSGLGNEEPGG